MRSPVRTPLDARAAAPFTVTSPALIIRATCEREYSGASRIETNTSRRMRSCSAAAVIVVGKITCAILPHRRANHGVAGGGIGGAIDGGGEVPAAAGGQVLGAGGAVTTHGDGFLTSDPGCSRHWIK